MTIDVVNESDVRGGHRAARRPGPVRARPAAHPPAGRALGAARRRGGDDRPARAVDGRARPHRRHVVPDGRAASHQGRRRARAGDARRRRDLPAGRRAPGGRCRAPRSTTSSRSCSRTASCTCSATTTPSPTSTPRCSGCRRASSRSGSPSRRVSDESRGCVASWWRPCSSCSRRCSSPARPRSGACPAPGSTSSSTTASAGPPGCAACSTTGRATSTCCCSRTCCSSSPPRSWSRAPSSCSSPARSGGSCSRPRS